MKYYYQILDHENKVIHDSRNGVADKVVIVGTLQDLTLDDFIKATGEKKEKKSATSVAYTEEFEKWWNVFPSSSTFVFKNRTFKTVPKRVLRDDKEKTFLLYEATKKKLPFTDKQMLHCLTVEVEERKQATWDKYMSGTSNEGYNAFQFMKSTVAYLNAAKFVHYLDEDPVEEESSSASDNNSSYA